MKCGGEEGGIKRKELRELPFLQGMATERRLRYNKTCAASLRD